jgi:hypothetical protein
MIPSSNLVRSNQARTSADVGAVDGFGKEVIEADSAIFPVWNGRNITYGVAIAKCPLLGHSALACRSPPARSIIGTGWSRIAARKAIGLARPSPGPAATAPQRDFTGALRYSPA